jgi:hypothetical protein
MAIKVLQKKIGLDPKHLGALLMEFFH